MGIQSCLSYVVRWKFWILDVEYYVGLGRKGVGMLLEAMLCEYKFTN